MNQDMTLWTLIEKIAKSIPPNRDRVEHLLNVKLAIEEQYNEYCTFWKGESKMSVNAVQITSALLRLNNKHAGKDEMLWLTVEGKCVSKAEVFQRFPNMHIVNAPTGHSINEETTYASERVWGDISFGFAERNPTCLSSVGFHTKE
jgi:hypothetical protein